MWNTWYGHWTNIFWATNKLRSCIDVRHVVVHTTSGVCSSSKGHITIAMNFYCVNENNGTRTAAWSYSILRYFCGRMWKGERNSDFHWFLMSNLSFLNFSLNLNFDLILNAKFESDGDSLNNLICVLFGKCETFGITHEFHTFSSGERGKSGYCFKWSRGI